MKWYPIRKRLLIMLPVPLYGILTFLYYQIRAFISGDHSLAEAAMPMALFFVGSFGVIKLLEAVRDIWRPKPLYLYYHIYSVLATYFAMHMLLSYSWYMKMLPFSENYFLHQLMIMLLVQGVFRYFYKLDYQGRKLNRLTGTLTTGGWAPGAARS